MSKKRVKALVFILIMILIIVGVKVLELYRFYINTRHLFTVRATFIEFLIGVMRGE